MSMNLPPLPVTLPPHGNSVTPLPPPPWSSSSSSPPPNLPVAHDQLVAATEIHDQMLPLPPSSATGDTVLTLEEEEDDETRAREELRLKEEWVKKMRGWLMILATLAASVTYSAGINPPGGFWQDDSTPSWNNSSKAHTAGNPVLADKSPIRYKIFFWCNANTFVTSIAIIVLLLKQSFFHAEVRLALLQGSVVGGMFTLMVAFGAGSSRDLGGIISIVSSFFGTLLYLIFCGWRIKKKSPARLPMSSREIRDVELGAMGQQTLPDH